MFIAGFNQYCSLNLTTRIVQQLLRLQSSYIVTISCKMLKPQIWIIGI